MDEIVGVSQKRFRNLEGVIECTVSDECLGRNDTDAPFPEVLGLRKAVENSPWTLQEKIPKNMRRG